MCHTKCCRYVIVQLNLVGPLMQVTRTVAGEVNCLGYRKHNNWLKWANLSRSNAKPLIVSVNIFRNLRLQNLSALCVGTSQPTLKPWRCRRGPCDGMEFVIMFFCYRSSLIINHCRDRWHESGVMRSSTETGIYLFYLRILAKFKTSRPLSLSESSIRNIFKSRENNNKLPFLSITSTTIWLPIAFVRTVFRSVSRLSRYGLNHFSFLSSSSRLLGLLTVSAPKH